MAVNAQATGIGVPRVGKTISTEFAVTGFQLAAGVFGGLAAIVAARRLEGVSRELHLSEMALPVLIAGTSTVIGAMLLPTV